MAAKIVKVNEAYSILTDASDELAETLRFELSFFDQKAVYNRLYKIKEWNGRKDLFSVHDRKITNGLIVPTLKALGHDVTIGKEVAQLFSPVNLEWKSVYITDKYKIAAHQIRLIETAIKKRRAVLESATNSGKSLSLYVLTRACVEAGRRVLIVVPSIMLVEQLMEDFLDYSDGTFSIEGMTGTIKPKNMNAIVSTWQSAVLKERSWLEQFDTMFIDEAHMAAGNSLTSVANACINANFRIGVTGSVLKDKLLQKQIESCFGPTIKIVDSKELVEVGFSAQITAKTIEVYHNEVEAQLDHHAETKIAAASKNKQSIINELVWKLQDQGDNTLILFSTIKQCKDTAKILNAHVIIGQGQTGKQKTTSRADIKKQMDSNRGQVLCATYGCLSTGVSIKEIDNLIIGSPISPNIKTSARLIQTIGRIARVSKTKKTATIYDPKDIFPHSSNLVISHRKRMRIYATQGVIVESL